MHPLLVGKTIAQKLFDISGGPLHYELSHLLGKGGFATVHAARRKSDDLRVACKKPHRHPIPSSRSTSMLDRLNAEINIHYGVKHPNIVELLNRFCDDNYVYLILEYCSNGDLERYLQEKKTLSENETRNICKQVVEGLVYLHDHDILHRDIKLSNLLLTDTYDVKIADFGLAKQLPSKREQTNETMCGTPNYISPEIASRNPHSFATDVWSLGILIATLLTGRPPFDTDTVHGTLSKVTQEKYELPTTFSDEAQDLVNNTLRKRPEDRPTIHEIRDHPFFSKEYSRSSHSYNESNSYQKLSSMGPNASVDSGLGVSMGRQRSVLNSTSGTNGNYAAHQYSSDPITSPTPSHHAAPMYMNTTARNKVPHDVFIYPVLTSTPAQQQPIHARQSPSFNHHSNLNDWLSNGSHSVNDPRPDSATSSVLSRDSGVARSDPKSSRDFSAKSETSSKTSHINNNNTVRNGLPSLSSSNTIQRLLQQQQHPQQVPTNFDPNTDQIREKLTPLNTQRLKILRQATKSFIMSIMENGEVVLETMRTKGTKRRIVDVFRVSSDGLRIITYTPNSRHGSPIGDHPPPIPRDKNAYQEYEFAQLPSEYWKKYLYAHKFVTLVRSRMAKIILYTPDAKCSLMETGVDFEAIFLCGVKISIYRENFKYDDPLKIKIINNIDKSESSLDFDRVATPNISAVEHFSPEIRQMLDNAITFYSFCLSKDQILEEHQRQFPNIQTFPVQFGKKHAQQSENNRPGSACSIGRSLSQQFGGSSSTVNELCIAPSTSVGTPLSMTSTRRIFASDTDVRSTKNSSSVSPMSSSASIANSNVHHSTSSSALRTAGYHHQVTYTPQTTVSRPLSVHPQQIISPSYMPENLSTSSQSNRQPPPPPRANMQHHYTSSTSLNSTASGGTITTTTNPGTTSANSLKVEAVVQLFEGTYHITFNDNSMLILRADCVDEQIFCDTHGNEHKFDRRQQHQPEAIQERLALTLKYQAAEQQQRQHQQQ
ncbi:unnamed protein product [Adineta steineri]|uniref:Serine/threonine-protein kinase PLK4 n=1 Tax=Adineta steineri TaxID=433720 RepID=A0A813NT34_9BILA|nr:unnamed protein product [Adineta steineri]CAF3511090.1 unnamed protein product [Adineta steineri]